jgi:hypothetical protein
MGLAGLLALSTADSGMPTVTAARPFRWGWRCLGEQRTDTLSNSRTQLGSKEKDRYYAMFPVMRRRAAHDKLFRIANSADSGLWREGEKSNACLGFRDLRWSGFRSRTCSSLYVGW